MSKWETLIRFPTLVLQVLTSAAVMTSATTSELPRASTLNAPGFNLISVAISSQINGGIRTVDIKEAKTYLRLRNNTA